MIACYDLCTQQCSFDFVQWLVIAKTHGATHIRLAREGKFKSKAAKYTNPEERLANIVKPAVALAGLEYSEGKKEGVEFYHGVGGTIEAYKKFGRIEKIKGVLPPKTGGITITLRNMLRETRNSDRKAWRRFAQEVGALVIPDYADQPIHLHERMSLYEGAKMNFLVGNGPATLCIFSEAPYAILKVAPEEDGAGSLKFLKTQGIEEGFQYPWRNEKQQLVWTGDSYPEIVKAYEKLLPQIGQ